MPYTIRKVKGGKYSVSGPSGVHAKGTTRAKAEAQVRLMRAVEHGWRPTGAPARSGNALRNAVTGSSRAVARVARSRKRRKEA